MAVRMGYLKPVGARRALDAAIVCGACAHVMAERRGLVLAFPQETEPGPRWRGWRREQAAARAYPGGWWRAAAEGAERQRPLAEALEILPAVIECPFCGVPNLMCPARLNLRADQAVARADVDKRRASLFHRVEPAAFTLHL